MLKVNSKVTRRVVRLLADGSTRPAIAALTAIPESTVRAIAVRSSTTAEVAKVRKALVASADEEHILSRNEIRRALTIAVLTPVTELEREGNEWLIQEHSTDPLGGVKIKGISKLGALQELNKIDSNYEAPKIAQQSSQRDKSALALASSSLFQEFLQQEARILKAGKIIDLDGDPAPELDTPAIARPAISQQDRERQEAEDREFAALMGDGDAEYVPDQPAAPGSSKRSACTTLYEPVGDDLRTVD